MITERMNDTYEVPAIGGNRSASVSRDPKLQPGLGPERRPLVWAATKWEHAACPAHYCFAAADQLRALCRQCRSAAGPPGLSRCIGGFRIRDYVEFDAACSYAIRGARCVASSGSRIPAFALTACSSRH